MGAATAIKDRCNTIDGLLTYFRGIFNNQRDKGTKFENLIRDYLLIEPKYTSIINEVWLWKDFPYRENGTDVGIDLVARTYEGEFWAIQCKFYDEDKLISKQDLDTFLSASSKGFNLNGLTTHYSYRLIVSTTDKYGKNAEDILKNQSPQVGRIGMIDLLNSDIDWEQFTVNSKIQLKEKYKPMNHQREAIDDVLAGFKKYNRGKLIMACGTGKTFTSLRIVEELLKENGTVLFLVPSIALISQTLSEWTAQCNFTYDAMVICSDNKASKGENSVDLGIPSTTDINRLCKYTEQIRKDNRNMHFIFSTYQSIEIVSQLQRKTNIDIDIIVCDEAHRTTGVTLGEEDESYFVRVHDNNFIHASKRLYMTATPRIFDDNVKNRAKDVDAELCSMDDEIKYGPEFHNLTFGEAVSQNLLSDYKVLVLAVDEGYVRKELQTLLSDENHEMRLDDSVKIMGCWNGLSKKSIEDDNETFKVDPIPMKRAVSFCNRISDSKKLVKMFNTIQEHVKINDPHEAARLVNVEIEHVDGNFNALEKKSKISWLKEDSADNTCRILTNARCLSEGIDVPALDAVIFLNPRSSMVDIIQSVGRVMRKSPGKEYGYIILPIGISSEENAYDALDNNAKYRMVWSVLQALRAHDNRFNNTINKIDLNKKKPKQIDVIGIGDSKSQDNDDGQAYNKKKNEENIQLSINLSQLEEWKDAIYAKMVKKVGSKRYWEVWAKDVAEIAKTHAKRINLLLDRHIPEIDSVFNDFLKGLQHNLNTSITKDDAIEMLSQHMITKPVFDAIFEGYEFVKYNPVSQTMQKMMDILDNQALDEEKRTLHKFYQSVRERAEGIDNSYGKQKIILELYEKFFKVALPKEVEKLGIVYTPTECVDFIINSVEELLNKEFNKSLSDNGVHIIDGFTGTGTFIVRLLQSGIIKKENLVYKYTNEIHANEIVLLAYYIAAINIEECFHEIMGNDQYVPFDGIVLTDTFQLYEDWKEDEFTKNIYEDVLPVNSERAKKQRDLKITVCMGNPPYSVGQKSTNDNSQNMTYRELESRISDTYAKDVKVNNINALYDSYIKAFRWASDRIEERGIIGFISNGAYIDNAAMSGFRRCLINEFTSIYVFNLRGNQRTSGETSKKEGGKIFGGGSRTPVAITCLIKNQAKENDGYIHYYDIGDYLSREDKLKIINDKHSIEKISWKKVFPDDNNDWINKKDRRFGSFIQIEPTKKFDIKSKTIFTLYSNGIGTSRDTWVYNFNKDNLINNVSKSINYYNNLVISGKIKENLDKNFIHWSSSLDSLFKNRRKITFDKNAITIGTYRPFTKQYLYFGKNFIHRRGQFEQIVGDERVPIICLTGVGANKDFSCFITDNIVDYQTMSNCQAFPLYWFREESKETLFNMNGESDKIRFDGISAYIFNLASKKYNQLLSKEDIFYYVYGFLHSPEYKEKFKADLKKSLPRILLVDNYSDFMQFSKSGRELANLHLNYENVDKYKGVVVTLYKENYKVKKMRFNKKDRCEDKTCIIYNDYISISNIPEKAYKYIVNGKSAIEWIMERYQVTMDKNCGIMNNPNDWSDEVGNPKYILELLLRVINVSVKTVDIIDSLPRINFD